MASQRNRRWLLTALTVIVAFTGLLAGATTQVLLTASARARAQLHSPTPTPTATLAPAATPTTTPEATLQPFRGHFTLHLTVSPASGRAGTSITITVLATDNATGGPAPGLTCHLRAPTGGGRGLFTTWPAASVTDESGMASWTAQIPSNAPGAYEVEVFAQIPPRGWAYKADAHVTISA